jgi:hypothetical protein
MDSASSLIIYQGHVADEAFSVHTPAFDTILKLDTEIRSLSSSISERIRFTPFTGPLPPPDVATEAAQRSPAYIRLHMQKHSLAVMTNETWRAYNLFFFFNSRTLCSKCMAVFLHRPYFAQALQDPSGEPLHSKFAPSVVAVCLEASTALVNVARSALALYPRRASRLWSIFFHCYGA